jgi:hypothetical protein
MPFLLFCISESVQIVMQRNYRFFFMFVFSATLLCIYVFAFCWVYIRRIMKAEETTIWKAMIKSPASIVLIIYTFICMWFVGGLTAFHLYLISTNQVINHFFLNLHINVLKIELNIELSRPLGHGSTALNCLNQAKMLLNSQNNRTVVKAGERFG